MGFKIYDKTNKSLKDFATETLLELKNKRFTATRSEKVEFLDVEIAKLESYIKLTPVYD